MANIIIFGCGMVGSAIALDLSSRHNVTVADCSPAAFSRVKGHPLKTQVLDVGDAAALAQHVKGQHLAISAVPGYLGYKTLETLIGLGINVADISFFPEDARPLGKTAKEKSVIAIVDIGVAPGLSHAILGHYNQTVRISHFQCLAGGLPLQRTWPFQYKAPFSPIDVIEEYTRPARLMRDGAAVTLPALSDCELHEFDRIGTLESFNTDGLRSLLHTMSHIPNMTEKTLRYPGHISHIKFLQAAGFFDTATRYGGINALEFTSEILKTQWLLQPGEPEFTVMQIDIRGERHDTPGEYQFA